MPRRKHQLAGKEWHNIYNKTAGAIKRNVHDKERHWNLDLNRIFAQIDAFAQRCRDLLEVCEGQLQFAKKGFKRRENPAAGVWRDTGPTIKKIS